MFDELVESVPHAERGRAGRFFFVTTVVYGAALVAFATLAIFWFNPGLAEAYVETTRIVPPPPAAVTTLPPEAVRPGRAAATTGPAVIDQPRPRQAVSDTVPVTAIPTDTRREVALSAGPAPRAGVPGGVEDGILSGPGAARGATAPPPPPQPSPPPAPTPKPETKRVSEGVAQGAAVRRVTPSYPIIARQARAAGVVQVQVTISPQGRVVDAVAVGGPPLLRDAAVQAARQWVFNPTRLSGEPVTVQGILTFNFVLN